MATTRSDAGFIPGERRYVRGGQIALRTGLYTMRYLRPIEW